MRLKDACAWLGCFLMLVAFVPQALAESGDAIRPFVLARYTVDDNIFRSSSDPESDDIFRVGAGADIETNISRQVVSLRGVYENVSYDENTSLDHDEVDASAALDWVVGDRLGGNLTLRYDRTIATFDEQVTRTKDDRTDRAFDGNAVYALTPAWELVGYGAIKEHRVKNRPTVDLDAEAVGGEVRYTTGASTKVGGRYGKVYGDYLVEEIVDGVPVNNDFEVDEYSATFYWQATGKSKLSLVGGYTKVKRDQDSSLDYDGNLVRGRYEWDATGKVRLDLRLWNEVQGREEISGFVVVRGVSLRPSMRITGKLVGLIDFLYEDVQYEGDASRASTGAAREDTNLSFAATMTYTITRVISSSLTYKNYDRDSNEVAVPYEYSMVALQVRATF